MTDSRVDLCSCLLGVVCKWERAESFLFLCSFSAFLFLLALHSRGSGFWLEAVVVVDVVSKYHTVDLQ